MKRSYSLRVALSLCDACGVPYIVPGTEPPPANHAVLLTDEDVVLLWTSPADVDEYFALVTFERARNRSAAFRSPRELMLFLSDFSSGRALAL